MTPVGYMAKHASHRGERLSAAGVLDIYSVSGCISKDFADYISFWKHNGYWFFDSPQVIREIADQNEIELAGTALFFYEAYELEYDEAVNRWTTFASDIDIPTRVELPRWRALEGYDVVTYSCGTTAECSPLSCNLLAEKLKTNHHCLFDTFEMAKTFIQDGRFRNSAPGPFRIIAVYITKWA